MKYFGTDGIRGLNEIFTDELLKGIGFAVSKVVKKPLVLIARDPRTSGLAIENTLTKYLTEYGVDVILAGMTPTPVAAFLTRAYGADIGIMISASHNPPEYNGIKFFGDYGGKLTEEDEAFLEQCIDNIEASNCTHGTILNVDGDDEYIDHLINIFKPKLEKSNILLDCANGAMAKIAPKLFEKAGAKVTVINDKTDGKTINEKCGATYIKALSEKMKGENYTIGFSFDGDGDRLITVKDGKIIDGDHTIYIVARYFRDKGMLKNPVLVGTVMTNLGTEAAIKEKGFRLVRTKVGDKYVFDAMVEGNYEIGGEASGHLIFYKYQNTGDGLLSALILALIDEEIGVLALDDINEYPQSSKDIVTTKEKIEKFKSSSEIASFIDDINKKIDGRTVVRASGTEPKIRIMAEAKTAAAAEDTANAIKEFILRSIE